MFAMSGLSLVKASACRTKMSQEVKLSRSLVLVFERVSEEKDELEHVTGRSVSAVIAVRMTYGNIALAGGAPRGRLLQVRFSDIVTLSQAWRKDEDASLL